MKFISWNINGLRAIEQKGALQKFLRAYQPDVVGLQEIKISESKLAEISLDFPGYHFVAHSALRPGYSGTALLIKEGVAFKKVSAGIGFEKFDQEGRVQVLELDKFYFLNIYFPNANHELSRLKFKMEFNEALLKFAEKLQTKKPVILAGDFNVAHAEVDLARPRENIGNPGFTDEERSWFTKLLTHKFIDTFRFLNGLKIQYSWWSFRAGARARNIGWRIDYFVVSDKMKPLLKKAEIYDKIMGSDHAPVALEIN